MSGIDALLAARLDLSAARAFVGALTGDPDSPVTWQTFDDDGERKDGNLVGLFHGPLARHAEALKQMNGLGAGVFIAVNETDRQGRKVENVTRVRAHFVDADGPMLRSYALPPSFRVVSSPGREHGYFLANGDATLAGFSKVQNQLATFYGTDKAVKDLPRVMRVPGFYHRKREPYLVRFLPGTGASYSVAELLATHPIEEKKAEPRKPSKAVAAPGDTRTEKLKRIAREVASSRPWSEGHRHESMKATTTHARKLGLPDDAVRAVALEFGAPSGLPVEEVDDTVEWTLSNVSPDPEETERPRTKGALALAPVPASNVHAEAEGLPEEWPERLPLPPLTDPLPTMPLSLLPKALAAWIDDTAARLGVVREFVAIPAIVAAGSVVGRGLAIRPKARDSWTVVPNLWGTVIGRSSAKKTPSLEGGLGPLRRLAAEALEMTRSAAPLARARIDALKAKRDGVLKKATRQGEEFDDKTAAETIAKLDVEIEAQKAKVRRRRYIVNDATVEALQEILSENPKGVLVLRDELVGLLQSWEREGRESDRSFYLSGWSAGEAGGSYESDRIGRGNVTATPCLSLLGSIQPAKLDAYVSGAVKRGVQADGLLPRFSLAVWPDTPNTGVGEDRTPDLGAAARASTIFRGMADLSPSVVGATVPEEGVPFLHFSTEAQALFDSWNAEHALAIGSPDLADAPAFEEHLGKYPKVVPSLALIFHLLSFAAGESPAGPVSEDALRLALDWIGFLELHARRLYSAELRGDLTAAHALAAKIQAGAVTDGMRIRAIAERDWSGLTRPGAVHAAADVLESLGWVRAITEETPGRPAYVLRLHPNLRREKP